MSVTKAWDWSKNTDDYWLMPCVESAYLAQTWRAKGFERFLDAGCGLGRHSVYMASQGFNVTSFDLSDYAVRHTQEWAEKEGLHVSTRVSNMLTLPYEDEAFQCAMAYNVIYHTDTAGFTRALSELRRVLCSGGELFLTLISKNTWGFLNADEAKKIDENTVAFDEIEAGENIPHFFVDINDIIKLFSGWEFVLKPKEWCDYNMQKPEFFSKHWSMLVRKP
ncbi:MAG TPA: class I SAM-dependent methyltransferase [Bacillota bacterium]|nr:class I SAM-dependent methyltransferase [Bacillota bacterium]